LSFGTFVLWLHLLALSIWIGGMVIVPFVVIPVARLRLGEGAEEFVEAVARRFQRLSRELIVAILLTGIFNVINLGVMTRFTFGGEFIRLLAFKVVFFGLMAVNQVWFTFVLIPSPEKKRLATWSAVVNVLLAALVIYLGLRLRVS
jgi:putative copper export protein